MVQSPTSTPSRPREKPTPTARGELIARTQEPCRAVTLRNADHFHFCDSVEQVHDLFKTMGPLIQDSAPTGGIDTKAMFEGMKSSDELCPGEHAYAMIQGLGLAHMDAHLRGNEQAAALLAGDLGALLGARGIDAQQTR